MGLLEDLLNTPNMREGKAQMDLSAAGSIMAKEPYKAGRLGMTGDVIQEMLSKLDPINWMGGMGSGGNELAGIFRSLGLARQGGGMSPITFAKELQSQPKYQRYKQLVEWIVNKTLGPEFKAYRGFGSVDPLVTLGKKARELPMATAATLKPEVAASFAKNSAITKPGHVAEMTATPESVLGLLPKRATAFKGESEILLDPSKLKEMKLLASTPPFYHLSPSERQAKFISSPPDELMASIIRDAMSNRQVAKSSGQAASIIPKAIPPEVAAWQSVVNSPAVNPAKSEEVNKLFLDAYKSGALDKWLGSK